MTDVLSDTIPGIRVVNAFNQQKREAGRFGVRNDDVTAEFNRIHGMWTTFWPLLMFGVHTTTVLVWAFAIPRLLGEGAPLSAGTFVSFLLYTTMFIAPIEVIGQMARTMNRATSSAHRIFEVLDSEPEVGDAAEPVRLEPVRGSVSFEGVTFAYDGSGRCCGAFRRRRTGRDDGLVVHRWRKVHGREPDRAILRRVGRSREDRWVDVRQLTAGIIASSSAWCSRTRTSFTARCGQHPLRNARSTLGDVIARGPGRQRARLHLQVEQGYDTVVGRAGTYLSGENGSGSRSPAVLHDPRILILDEATSSVDTETERESRKRWSASRADAPSSRSHTGSPRCVGRRDCS